jgi:hypothetical protein
MMESMRQAHGRVVRQAMARLMDVSGRQAIAQVQQNQ